MDKNLSYQILSLAKELTTIPSFTEAATERDKALEIAKRELKDFPMEEFVSGGFRSLLVQNTAQQTKQFKIILNAHLDVIPASKEQFTPVVKDGKLYGRGTYDMKAAAAVMILLFKNLAKKLPYAIALQITTDEETNGKHCTKYQVEQGVRADFIISGECGSNFAIVSQAKGILWFKLHTVGVAAHGAYLWKGKNALLKLNHALYELQKLFPIPEKESWITTMNLAKIETANDKFNHVPAAATAYVDIRFIEQDEKRLLEKIKKVIPSDITMEIITHEVPEYITHDNPYLLALKKAITETTGIKPKLISAHAPSDLRHFNTVGCHGVQFGPIGHGQHEDEEWVDIKSLENYFFVLETFLTDAIETK